MAYARYGADGSDVYVFMHYNGCFVCFGCEDAPNEDELRLPSRSALIAHLEDHRKRGHFVPEQAFERLRSEIAAGHDEWDGE